MVRVAEATSTNPSPDINDTVSTGANPSPEGYHAFQRPFGVDLLSRQAPSNPENPRMGKPTETATEWSGVPDSHNDD